MATTTVASMATEVYNQTESVDDERVHLHWLDYVILAVILLLTLFTGILFRFLDRKKKSQNDFLFGGKQMSFFPIATSLFMSGAANVAVLRNPLEVYHYGIVYWLSCASCLVAAPIIAHVFAALFHLMELSTSFQFLEIRFGPILRQLCSVVYGIITLIHSAASLHITGVAISQVTVTPVWLAILILGVVGLSYTSLGGLKAVVWGHLFQCVILLCSLVTLLILATVAQGGAQNVWNIAREAGKLDILASISPNPLARSTLWTYLLGGFFWYTCTYSYEQFAIQRYTALKSVGHVIGAVYTVVPLVLVFTSLYSLLGLVMFAFYQGCDPLAEGIIDNKNLLLPLMAAKVTESYPGLMGLFVAGISSASIG
ncbi:hypothetical protein CAPTEDRAFT_176983 [Capitella teleta]|uniref:Uncharacterized protein n=1 Tax=Capitella teleta TaxID=283909 RepID=R7TXB6_CAPTE|nr:hypothetical protein CAPTEDRAFT_176983 [Capitella teleta]|eukprot:ELT98339.1 hypothetical protein CAPTEDRAFT_176983 [Capitella teleta]